MSLRGRASLGCMPITQATPYLFFAGNAGEAIEHYTRTLGAEPEAVMPFEQMPAEHRGDLPPGDAKRIMHATLRIGAARLMLSDLPSNRPPYPADQRQPVEINLAFDDDDELAATFEALAEGGRVIMAPHDAFWGGKFGNLIDKFGIAWMFSSTPS
jgi:PhnB protein